MNLKITVLNFFLQKLACLGSEVLRSWVSVKLGSIEKHLPEFDIDIENSRWNTPLFPEKCPKLEEELNFWKFLRRMYLPPYQYTIIESSCFSLNPSINKQNQR